MIQEAVVEDLDALVAVENRKFNADRLSRRSLRYLLTRANATTFVDKEQERVRAYAIVLYNMGTSLARLYSLGVDPDFRGHGIGAKLLEAAEQDARNNDCVTMRLEVRSDNVSAINLYKKQGYKQFDVVPDYYEDHTEALRFEKALVPHLNPEIVRVFYYQQTLDSTCGPAALMMAMKTLEPGLELHRKLELRIWREGPVSNFCSFSTYSH